MKFYRWFNILIRSIALIAFLKILAEQLIYPFPRFSDGIDFILLDVLSFLHIIISVPPAYLFYKISFLINLGIINTNKSIPCLTDSGILVVYGTILVLTFLIPWLFKDK